MAGTACILDIIGPPAQSCVSCRTGSGAFNNLLGYSSVFGSADGTQSMQDEYSTIVQGSNNQVLAYGQACHGFNAIVNGCQMTIEGWNDFIGTGDCSCIIDWQPGASNAKGHNGIVQGYHTCILCSYVSGVAFGAFHDMECNYTGAILGGDHNCIRPDFAGGGTGFVYRSNIVGGVNNVICGAHCATIGGGSGNQVLGNGDYGFIGSGNQNVINANAPQSFIGTGQGNVINSNSSFSFIGTGNGHTIGTASGFSVISGGQTNAIGDTSVGSFIGGGGTISVCNNANYSSMGGGSNNTIQASSYNSIFGGQGNTIFGVGEAGTIVHSFIGGGHDNAVKACAAALGGGCDNVVCKGSDYGFLGAGTANCLDAAETSVLAGGDHNCIALAGTQRGFDAILGGGYNQVLADTAFSGIMVGGQNIVCNTYAAAVVAGDYNCIVSPVGTSSYVCRSFIGAGNGNCVYATLSSIVGGEKNVINDTFGYNFIGGGNGNSISDSVAAIAGGQANQVLTGGFMGFMGAGEQNTLSGGHSAIVSGRGNTINPGADCSFIGAGQVNQIDGAWNSVVGGYNNQVNCCFSIIGGGLDNVINVAGVAPVGTNGIFVGTSNQVTGHTVFSAVGAGGNNQIDNAYASYIAAGDNNCIKLCSAAIPTLDRSFIGAGGGNCLVDGYAAIVSGQNNYLKEGGRWGMIGAGADNFLAGGYGILGGGCKNTVGGSYNGLLAGCCNNVGGDFAFMGGGACNTISLTTVPALARYNTLGGGCCNIVCGGQQNGIFSGGCNTTSCDSTFNALAGGCRNFIGSFTAAGAPVNYSFLGGGTLNTVYADCSAIAGGVSNSVRGLGFSGILSGEVNTVTGSHSSILGGSGNADNGFNCVGMSGCNVMGVVDCAYHSNTYVAQNMFDATFIAPPAIPGLMYFKLVGLEKQVFIV